MIRVPRRIVEKQPGETTPGQALNYELTATWPRDGSRVRFWTGPTIPAHLSARHAPDPRQVLLGEEGRLAYDAELEEWREARLGWLREEAHG